MNLGTLPTSLMSSLSAAALWCCEMLQSSPGIGAQVLLSAADMEHTFCRRDMVVAAISLISAPTPAHLLWMTSATLRKPPHSWARPLPSLACSSKTPGGGQQQRSPILTALCWGGMLLPCQWVLSRSVWVFFSTTTCRLLEHYQTWYRLGGFLLSLPGERKGFRVLVFNARVWFLAKSFESWDSCAGRTTWCVVMSF